MKNGVLVKTLPVATGRSKELTPEGSFKVVRKLINPYYSKLKIPGGSPRNPLGVRWLGLDALGTSGGTYGIHGTSNPRSIGKYASGGCIRMYNRDVIWLYGNTPLGTPVDIINGDWDLTAKPISVNINGLQMPIECKLSPYLANDRVMVPGRLVAENLGCTVLWNETEQTAYITNGSIVMTVTINSTAILVNGIAKNMDQAAVLKNDTVYLPVRALADTFGYQVAWDNNTSTVSLTKAVAPTDSIITPT